MRVRDWRLVLTLLTALGFAGPAAAGQDREKPTMLNNTQLNELIQAKFAPSAGTGLVGAKNH